MSSIIPGAGGGVKSVQRVAQVGVSAGTVWNLTISAVDMDKSFITTRGYSNTGSSFECRLTSPTNLQVEFQSGGGQFDAEIVELL